MKNILQTRQISFAAIGIFAALVLTSFLGIHSAQAAITAELELGSRGGEVTELQQFLATNAKIYPEGIVSGYFGALTKAAVIQFQVAYDISQVGRVGPQTMAKINDIMSSGFGLDTSAPTMANASLQTRRNDATINWTTNEFARGQVYYDTFPIRSDETMKHAELAYVSGTSAPNNTDVRSTQSVVIQGLTSNTLYYYLARAIDNSGNVTMTLSNTFRTD